jgi:hypothetical protein
MPGENARDRPRIATAQVYTHMVKADIVFVERVRARARQRQW